MNKTVNINIGGLFFHIDEDAYQKLGRYFEAVKKSIADTSGKDEIMKDIEMRVAEIFTEKQLSDKHVINMRDVDAVVAVMGQPEDYRIDNEEEKGAKTTFTSTENSGNKKKLYRDTENATIAGVCSGLGHYFGIDAVWLKIFLLIFTLAGGSGIIAYIILWIAIPEAKTTSEKLQMFGEPVNISNIEKKVREEISTVSDRIKNVDYEKVGNQIAETSKKAGNGIAGFLVGLFGVFAKIIGAFMVMIGSISLFGIFISCVLLLISASLPNNFVYNHIVSPIGLETPLWLQGIIYLFALGIPFLFLLILGLKLLIPSFKSIGNAAKYSLLGIWILAVGVLSAMAILEATQTAYEGKSFEKQIIKLNPNDTLFVKFKNNDVYSSEIGRSGGFELKLDETNKEVLYSENIYFKVLPTDEPQAYVKIEKEAKGKSPKEAKDRAEAIRYHFDIKGNSIVLDSYFLVNPNLRFRRNQQVNIFLYVPKNLLLKMDKSVEQYDASDDEFFNMHYSSSDYIYKVGDSQVKCLNCPASENEYNDVITEDVTVVDGDSTYTKTVKVNGEVVTEDVIGKDSEFTINKDGVVIKTGDKSNNKESVKSIKINENGLEIKTK